MTHKLVDAAYAHSPSWVQKVGVNAYGRYWRWARFGGSYGMHCALFRQREWADESAWRRFQAERLADLWEAAQEAPFYRSRWSPAQKKAARAGMLAELPLLTKGEVRRDPKSFLSRKRRPRLSFHTSGSTGTPIVTYWTLDELRESMALRETRSADWAGVSFGEPRATFSGRMAQPDSDEDADIYRFNAAEEQVYLSPFHLSPRTVAHYVEALRRHGSAWGTGYAVSFYVLATLIEASGLRAPKLKAVVTTSEKVTPKMRQTIERVFECRVFEEYSTVENVVFASECPDGRLHVSPDACIVEILRPDGSPAPPGEVGEVVATGLFRASQPLIRYRVGDLAAWDPGPCACGRGMPVLKEVLGRVEDEIVGPDGRRLVRFHGVFLNLPSIREGQIVQEALDRILVRIVPEAGFGPEQEKELINRTKQRLGSGVAVSVQVVDHIDRDSRGKFRAVVSHVSRADTLDQ